MTTPFRKRIAKHIPALGSDDPAVVLRAVKLMNRAMADYGHNLDGLKKLVLFGRVPQTTSNPVKPSSAKRKAAPNPSPSKVPKYEIKDPVVLLLILEDLRGFDSHSDAFVSNLIEFVSQNRRVHLSQKQIAWVNSLAAKRNLIWREGEDIIERTKK